MAVEMLGATLWTLDGDALGRLAGSSLGDGLGLSDKEGDAIETKALGAALVLVDG